MKRFIYICSLLFVNLIYSQFTQNIPYQNFIGHNQGGGNQSVVTITSTSISISFNAYFSATNIQNKYVATLNYSSNLPDMTLGTIQNTSYRILIISKKVYIVSDINESVSVLSGTISSNLSGFVPISSTDIKTISTVGENFIREIVYLTELGDSGLKKNSTTFFDGLGRPIQQVAHGQSGTGKDIITHMEYDAFGRQTKEFLPYASQTTTLNYNPSAPSEVFSFYTSYNEGTQNPYSEKLLEASPLNRILKQAAPGNAWAMGSGKEIKFDYQTNTVNDVKLYKATTTWNATLEVYAIAFVETGFYPENQLYKTITFDENSAGLPTTKVGRTEEYKDKEGKVILKRTFNNNIAHETYYVYDMYGNLTYVIPPAVSGTIDQTKLDNMCYQYKYDNKNRLVEKKLPGKQWEYMVYDKLDRVVATGPAYSPWGGSDTNKGWMLTKYDVFNRPVYTGWYNGMPVASSTDRKNLQATVNANTLLSESKTTSTVTIDGIATKYTNTVFPTSFKLLTVTYYDNYDYPNAPTLPSQIEEQNTQTTNLKGLATGAWIRVLDNASATTNETSYTLYDQRYRPIRSYTKNYLGGYIQVDTKLDWAGKTLYTVTSQRRTTTSELFTVKDRFEYSSQDRVTKHVQQLTSPTVLPEQLLTLNSYDELGQQTSKKVGGTDVTGAQALQTVDYNYNIRGWLKEINDVNNIGADLFAFKLTYNQKENGTAGLFNGNISETLWRTSADNIKRKYTYSYDDLNRLLNADYSKPGLTSVPNNYAESMSYDKNGNITALTRYGDLDSDGMVSANLIDELKYTYDANNANLLKKVLDLSNSPQGFNETADIATGDSDGLTDQTDDYEYDANGNMIKDTNKSITSITYNHLNLPTNIVFSGTTNGTISYLYNATGQKLRKKVVDATSLNTTDYLNGFQYTNTTLDFFPHAEGYVKYTPPAGRGSGIYSYVFNYTDHLGNIRVSYGKDPSTNVLKVLEENHYYPFGLKHTNYNSDKLMYVKESDVYKLVPINTILPTYKYKYNGKELQEELGLNMYDYGARNYDPALGRWMNVDPLAEMSRRFSPYTYCYDNPLVFVDYDGMFATPPLDYYNEDGKKIGTDGVSDGRKAVVTDNNQVNAIKKTDKSGGTTALSDVSSAVVLPSDTALQESLNVLQRHIDNGGQREESSLVMNNGTVVRGETGPEPTIVDGVQTAPATLPALPAGTTTADVETTIHAHPVTVLRVGENVYPQSASIPSTGPGSDGPTFQQYNTNIIVGALGTITNVTSNPDGSLKIPRRDNGAVIYNRDSTPRLELTKRAIERILTPRQ